MFIFRRGLNEITPKRSYKLCFESILFLGTPLYAFYQQSSNHQTMSLRMLRIILIGYYRMTGCRSYFQVSLAAGAFNFSQK